MDESPQPDRPGTAWLVRNENVALIVLGLVLVVLGAVTCYAPWAGAADRVFGPLQMTLGGALASSGLTRRRFGIRSPMPRRRR